MHKFKIRLTGESDTRLALARVKKQCNRKGISAAESAPLLTEISAALETLSSSGLELLEQGCNFEATRVVKSADCEVSIHADYHPGGSSILGRIRSTFFRLLNQ